MKPCHTPDPGLSPRALIAGISVNAIAGCLHFDRPTLVRRLATATLRGRAGHGLRDLAPHMVSQWFKPGQGHHIPPACLFQSLHGHAGVDGQFPFRIVTWDPPGELLPASVAALRHSEGKPFGESGTLIERVEFGEAMRLECSGAPRAVAACEIHLVTPLQVSAGSAWADASCFTLGHLVKAMVNRLNALSLYYGNGQQMDAMPFLADAAMVREVARQLDWVSPRRYSSPQDTSIAMSGVVGVLSVQGLSSLLADLLGAAAIFHLGRHTAEGCGYVLLA